MAKNWQDYPHIVALVGELQKWKEDFQITEYIEANESGYDQTGRIKGASDQTTSEIAEDYCWTHFSSDGEWIEAGVKTGDWGSGGVYGWFIGKVPRNGQQKTLQTHAFACSICQGNYTYEDEDGEELDCEACSEEDAEFINLVNALKL